MVGACLIDIEKAFDSVWIDGLLYKLRRKKVPEALCMLIRVMLTDRKFKIQTGGITSSMEFSISDGLQQGTLNAPLLFNIYTTDALNLYNINQENGAIKSCAYADDLILYVEGKKPNKIQLELQNTVNSINNHYKTWKLKIHPLKCETIVFRKTTRFLSRNQISDLRTFRINITDTVSNEIINIPHNNSVRYFGVQIDNLMRMCRHVDLQANKALRAFHSYGRLFYSRFLSNRAKIICYMLLIRPIISYATPIWFNLNAAIMEKLRRIERQILRHCIHKHRSASSNFTKYISNVTLYEETKISRIDNFILQLTRDYYATSINIEENSLIKKLMRIDDDHAENCLQSGYLPPQAFTFLDKKGYIQNDHNIPTIYHWPRHKKNKKITYDPLMNPSNTCGVFKYSTSLSSTDSFSPVRLRDKYWWLNINSTYFRELKDRLIRHASAHAPIR